jgi:hypothetical protein
MACAQSSPDVEVDDDNLLTARAQMLDSYTADISRAPPVTRIAMPSPYFHL